MSTDDKLVLISKKLYNIYYTFYKLCLNNCIPIVLAWVKHVYDTVIGIIILVKSFWLVNRIIRYIFLIHKMSKQGLC